MIDHGDGNCSGDGDMMPWMRYLQELGYVCKGDWYLAPACAELGDDWKTGCE